MNETGKSILVAEDYPNDQLLIQRAFRKLGRTEAVHIVGDGGEAIAYLKAQGPYRDRKRFPYPSCLITDLKMPKIDGFSVLEFLRLNPACAIVPTIVLSAASDPDDIKRAYLLGASAYHDKPHNFSGLCDLLSAILTYWSICKVPIVDRTGHHIPTVKKGKLGERYPHPSDFDQNLMPNIPDAAILPRLTQI